MDDMDTTNDMKLYAKVHILLLVSISRARANTTYWFIVSTKKRLSGSTPHTVVYA